jgi:phage-related protein
MLPAAGAVTALAGGLGMAAKAAAEDEKSANLLAQQLKRTLGANDEVTASMAAFVDKTQLATNVTDDELRPALAGLVRFTKDAQKAQDLLTLSVDTAVATGKDLTAVSTAIGRAYDGNFTSLKKLGIPLDDNIIKTKDFTAAQKALTDQFGGAAAANMNTFEGRLKNVKIRFDEFVETIGYKVLPIVDSLLRNVTKLVDIYGQKGLGGVLDTIKQKFLDTRNAADGTVSSNGKLYNTAVKARNGFTYLFNAARELSNDLLGTEFRITELKNAVGTDFR